MKRACAACGGNFDRDAKSRKQFCDRVTCKRARARGRKRKERTPEPAEIVQLPGAPVAEESSATTVADATCEVLAAAGRLHTPPGLKAMVLAARIDRASLDTASGLAAIVRAHEEVMAIALAGVVQEADPVDELKERRLRRQRA